MPASFASFAGGGGGGGGRGAATRSVAVSDGRGMVATSQPLAALAGLDVLRAGGNALDAAIAANAMLGLVEPTGCGVGGDLFALLWSPREGRLIGYNGSGRAPAGLSLGLLSQRGLDAVPRFGPLAVTVPGCVEAWGVLHARCGVLPWERLFEPAIMRAREGFAVTPIIAEGWAGNVERLAEYPRVRELYAPRAGGRTPRAGEVFRNPALARTLGRIAHDGPRGFYEGELARGIARSVAEQGGVLSEGDLRVHAGEFVEPIATSYRDWQVCQLPPNGQGLAALQLLNIMETMDVRAMAHAGEDGLGWSADLAHAFIEAKKLVFEDRARLYADPAFASLPIAELLSKDYARARAARIDMARAALSIEPGLAPPPTGADTVYLAAGDASGMLVSLIQSNFRGMGSGVVPADASGTPLGFMLQNRGEQFATQRGHPNCLAPGKRPFHTIIPGFLMRDGQPWAAFGVMGGAMQPQAHAQVLINMLDLGMDVQAAGDAPRIHHDGSTEPAGLVTPMRDGGVVNLEPALLARVGDALARRGHRLAPAPTPIFGGYQLVLRDPTSGAMLGASESRKDGVALGL